MTANLPAVTGNRRTEYLPLSEVVGDARNPKGHDLDVIDSSINRFGFIESIVRDDRTGLLISGHGRTEMLREMKARGEMPPDGVVLREDGEWLVPVAVGWASRTDTEAAGALIALNRAVELGGWVDDSLLDLLDSLREDEEEGLTGIGFGEEDIEALRERLAEISEGGDEEDLPEDESDRAPTTGEMLSIADVSWGEPTHVVHHGEVWSLGRHLLVVAKVHDEHAVWMPLLQSLGPTAVFAPYPEPFLTTGTLAQTRPLLLVQPNTYLAGHLLDKHASAHPEDTVERRDA